MATAILILGALGGLSAPALGALILGFGVVARREVTSLPSLLRAGVRELREAVGVVGLALLAGIALLLLARAATPPVDWDSLMYHLRVPAQWLQAGRVYLPEDNLHAALDQLVHVLYVPLLAFGSPSAPALLSTLFALVLACAACAFARRFLHAETARFIPLLLWGSTLLPLVATTPRVDVTLALYLFLGHYALLLARQEPAEPRFFDVSALLLGFAFGVKHHALAYAAALGPVVLWATLSTPGAASRRLRRLARFAAIGFAAALPWLLKNAILIGSPLYPLLSSRRMEPWLESLYAARGWPGRFPEGTARFLHDVREPVNLFDLFFEPGRLSIEVEASAYFLNALLLALPLWALFRRDSTLKATGLPALAYVAILLLVSLTTNLRYLIPALVPLTLVATEVVVRLAARGARPRFVRALLWTLTLAALWPTGRALRREVAAGPTAAYLSGALTRSEYLLRHREPEVSAYGRIVAHVNRTLPTRSRVLMVLESRGFYVQRDVLQDNLLTNWPLLAPLVADGGCLEETAITHVLVNQAALRYYARRGLDPEALAWPEFLRFRDRCLALEHARSGFLLYRLRR